MLQAATFSGSTQLTVRTGKKVVTQEACYWQHAWQRFKQRIDAGTNGILECKSLSLSENAHSTAVATR
jgi:hypothetical protein